MKLEKLLGVWQLANNGRSVPISYNALCREIEKLAPDQVGFKIVNLMESEGYVSTLPNGSRILTHKGIAQRIPLPVRPVVTGESRRVAAQTAGQRGLLGRRKEAQRNLPPGGARTQAGDSRRDRLGARHRRSENRRRRRQLAARPRALLRSHHPLPAPA